MNREVVGTELIDDIIATLPDESSQAAATRNGGVAPADIVDRAGKYLDAMPAGVAGENGSGATFAAACALVVGFNLSVDAAFPILADRFNPRCQPPWSDAELRHKLEDADKRDGPRGELLVKALTYQEAATNGKPEDKPITYRRWTCAELAATDFPIEYLVDWTLVAGQPCVVSGAKKTLKTNIMLALAFALATGSDFLDKFRVRRPVRVTIMTAESGIATVKETIIRIAAAAGWRLEDIPNLIISDQLPIIGHLEHADALRKMLTDDQTEVLILDPAYLCIDTEGNEGSLFAMGAKLRHLAELCLSLSVTPVVAHHNKKNVANPFAVPELEDIAWAGFSEFARQWMLIGRREKYEPGTGNHRLWFNVGGSAGHSHVWALNINEGPFDAENPNPQPRIWEITLDKAAEARQDAEQRREADKQAQREAKSRIQIDTDKRAIIKAIGTKTDTKTAIRDHSGVRSPRYDVAFAELLDEKVIVPDIVVKGNGREYEAYRLKKDDEESQQDATGRNRTDECEKPSYCDSQKEQDALSIREASVSCCDAPESTNAPKKTKRKKKRPDAKSAKHKPRLRVRAADDDQEE